MPLAAIALGSNLGDRNAILVSAVAALTRFGHVVAVSAFAETDPVGYVAQPPFLNGAALLQTEISPLELLRALLLLEQDHGRDRTHGIAKGPRTLDLDLLLYDNCVMQTAELTLPHPAMHSRLFVLRPLAEIAPAWQHPILRQTIAALLSAFAG